MLHTKINLDYKWNTLILRKNILLFLVGYVLCILVGTINFVNQKVIVNAYITYLLFLIVGIIGGASAKITQQMKRSFLLNCLISTGIFYITIILLGAVIGFVADYIFLKVLPAFSWQELYYQTVLHNSDILLLTFILLIGYYVSLYIKDRKVIES